MDLNLLIPFSKDARKTADLLAIDVKNPSEDQLTLVKTILTKIMNNNFVFPELDKKYMTDYFSFYPIARIILSHINKERFYSQFSKFYTDNIKKELKDPKEAFDLLELNYKQKNNFYLVEFEKYIKAKIFSEKDKLTNQIVKDGFVHLSKEKAILFVARFVGSRVLENLPLNVSDTSNHFKKIANELDNLFKPTVKKYDIKSQNIKYENFPPCMQKILSTMLEHGNPSHMERYYFATFCFSIKMSFEDVLNFFKNTNDYDEKIAKYQLEKIKKYSCPSCDTIKSMGLCYPDDLCSSIKSPVGYYLKKTYNKEEINEEKEN